MEDAIKQIGERLKGLRDVLDIPAQEVADLCGVSLDAYTAAENGEGELSLSSLQKISKKYGIAFDVLVFGEEPHMNSYFLTRKGQGLSVERRKAYKYQSLASGFMGRTVDPFIVVVEPKPEGAPVEKNSHQGQEFHVVVEGCLEETIGHKVLVLNPGDSIYFNASLPHCMRALGGKPAKFLAVII